MSKGGHYLSKPTPSGKRKNFFTILLILFMILVMTAIGAGALYYDYVLGLITQAEYIAKDPSNEDILSILRPAEEGMEGLEDLGTAPPLTEVEDDQEYTVDPDYDNYSPDLSKVGKVINIMIVGQSAREGEESRMADTMILATLNCETKTLTLTSFLRDTYIKLPNYAGYTCGKNRINTCYALGYAWGHTKGAMEMLSLLMEQQFGVEVDYTIEIGLHAFKLIIDTLGGMDVELTQAEADYLSKEWPYTETFEAGPNHLDGTYTLAYVRMRKSSAEDNDFKRTNRQREVITKILNQARSLSLVELNEMLNQVLPLITTDMPKEQITTYAMELLPILPGLKIESNQCPAEGTYKGEMVEIYGVSSGVLIPNVEKNKELMMAIAEWDKLELAESEEN